jgi:AcrR family transcriptional regulator
LQSLQVRTYGTPVTDLETVRIPGRRDRKKQQTRTALIAAALRLVDERGLDRVTVEDISEAADVSPRTFFNYFATKDEAIIGDQFVDHTGTTARFRAVPAEVPVIGALLLALGPALTEMQADQQIWFLRMRVLTDNPSLVSSLLARSASAEQELVAAIAERVGVPQDSAYPMLTAAVTGAAVRTAMIRWIAGNGTRTLSELVHEAFGVLATGLAEPTNEERR